MESIKRVRRARGLSLTDVSRGSGLTRETISRAERADTDPRGSTLAALGRGMGVPVCAFFERQHHHGKKA
jgi:transcriptional regulator with XRE-family HTH domain